MHEPRYLYPTVVFGPPNGLQFRIFVVWGHGHGEEGIHTADEDQIEEARLRPVLWFSKHAIFLPQGT